MASSACIYDVTLGGFNTGLCLPYVLLIVALLFNIMWSILMLFRALFTDIHVRITEMEVSEHKTIFITGMV